MPRLPDHDPKSRMTPTAREAFIKRKALKEGKMKLPARPKTLAEACQQIEELTQLVYGLLEERAQ